ncbi:NAD(P)H-quinone oxidoreductase [Lichenicoccus sp.]|uniref:NAD(P)H-quinone oxidoreductase n=1 Tax=Lichenicoccus sp. TaxID=2781899 RepID=UPI003D10FAC5
MRFIGRTGDGGPEVLRVEQGPVPQPRPGEVLIRVLAAGLNGPDLMQRRGLYPPPADASPVLGLEVAGEVAAVGPAQDDAPLPYAVGDRVCALVNGGGYAEYCAAPARQCLPWPDRFDAVRAAALPENYFTVWANLFHIGNLRAGQTLLVHGGSSGIGTTAIQLARARGAIPYATAGTDEKCAICRSLGAEAAIDYRREDFAERIKTLTAGRGVDVILDMIGASYFQRNLDSLAEDGRLTSIAVLGGDAVRELKLSQVMRRRLTLTGSTLRPRSAAFKAGIAAALQAQVWPLLAGGAIRPLIHAVLPFTDAAGAHTLMERGEHSGKIMLSLQ